jgi:hypothetical protein
MAGMWELPQVSGKNSNGCDPAYTFRHSITTTNYTVRVWRDASLLRTGGGKWIPVAKLRKVAMTGLARKIFRGAELL